MTDQTPAPMPPRHEVEMPGGEQRTVLMSFGLLQRLTPLVGGAENMAAFDFDPDVRQLAIEACLCPRNAQGKPDTEWFLPDDFGLDQAELLLDWVKGHVLGFFIKRLKQTLTLMGTSAGQVQDLNLSQTSTSLSALKTASS